MRADEPRSAQPHLAQLSQSHPYKAVRRPEANQEAEQSTTAGTHTHRSLTYHYQEDGQRRRGEAHPAGTLQGGRDAGAPGRAHPRIRRARRRRPLHEGLPLVTNTLHC